MSDASAVPTYRSSGSAGRYLWLTNHHEVLSLLRIVPEIVVGKAVALTAIDSGTVRLRPENLSNGWISRGEIAYHRQLPDLMALPLFGDEHDGEGFYELYTFLVPVDVGQVHTGDIFENNAREKSVTRFVNLFGFSLGHGQMDAISDLFWRQVSWMKPESYLADGSDHMTFVTSDRMLHARAQQGLKNLG